MHGAYHAFENTVTELLVGQVETHRFTQKARGYKSCLEAALHQNHIPTSVYHALIQAVKENQKVLHDYVAMRKERLGVKELHYWDLSVPLVEDSDRTFSYEEAVDIVIQSVAPLGKEYQSIVEKGLRKDGWVDVYEKKGKRSGAYSSGSYDTMPYILLNYQGTISDVMTLSHEVGHSMHSYLSRQGQSYHNAQYPIFLAEIASTFHERLTYTYMMQNEKDREFLIYQQIEGIRSTFFRQAMFAEFELKIHEEGPMTAHKLKEIYLQLNREYFGPALTLDDVLGCEYLRIPHFYYNFYVYQYATGIAAAYALGDIVEKEGPDRYLRFLQSGGSAYPIDILKEAGVDITSKEALSGIIGFWKNLLAKNRTGK